MREEQLLADLRRLFSRNDPSVVVGSGPDDCAHIRVDAGGLAMTTDAFSEGSHFLADTPPEAIARKAVAASVSDLAASGCDARWLLVSLGARKGLADGWTDRFAVGLRAEADKWNATVVGGDLISSPGGIFISVTAVGVPLPGGPLLRSGGRAGDILAVTDSLGGSILAKHLAPIPRLAEMKELLAFATGPDNASGELPTACMDISDGLALDLSRLCRESGVGAVVDGASIPVSRDARALAAADNIAPQMHALRDGEDFELLVAMPPALWEAFSNSDSAAAFTRIGKLTAEKDLLIIMPDGEQRPLAPEGFEHEW